MKRFITILVIGVFTMSINPLYATETTPTPPPRVQKATVVRVIDGDTFVVKIDRTNETIRLIGIDTPELHHPRRTVECFAKEASQNITAHIAGKELILVDEPSGSNRDSYGRLLRYAYVQEKAFAPVTFVNAAMVQEGYAYAYTRFDFRYKEQFKTYQQNARDHGRGLWAKTTCKGKR